MTGQYDPTPEQRKAIEAYVNGSLVPLIGTLLTKQLGMAAVFLRDKLAEPTLAGGTLEPVHPNHRADLRYVRETLQMVLPVLKNEPLRQQVQASINGMTYIIDRTEQAARGVKERDATEAEKVCYEAYAALGTILLQLAEQGHPQAEKLMDNLSQARLVHGDVLPFADVSGVGASIPAEAGAGGVAVARGETVGREAAAPSPLDEQALATAFEAKYGYEPDDACDEDLEDFAIFKAGAEAALKLAATPQAAAPASEVEKEDRNGS